MSFTSQVVRIGEGWEGPSKVEDDVALVYAIREHEASAMGAEGSSDDSKELFPDTFVDMAKEATSEIEQEEENQKNGWFFKRRKKKKKKFYN